MATTYDNEGRKKKSSGAAALAKDKMKTPGTKFTDWRASSGERWGIARARMQEKFAVMGASVSYGMYTITHPAHPIRRKAAKEAEQQKKELAAEKRVQQEAAIHSTAAAKRVRAREARVANLNQAAH